MLELKKLFKLNSGLIKTVLATIILGTVLSIGLSFVRAYSPPTAPPPGGNISAPINVGPATQTKSGGLTVGGVLTANGGITLGGVTKTSWPSVSGDNLGNHIATQNLDMGSKNIFNASSIIMKTQRLRADVNGDGFITVEDAIWIGEYTAGLRTIDMCGGSLAEQLRVCNVTSTLFPEPTANDDATDVSITDALFIVQYVMGGRSGDDLGLGLEAQIKTWQIIYRPTSPGACEIPLYAPYLQGQLWVDTGQASGVGITLCYCNGKNPWSPISGGGVCN